VATLIGLLIEIPGAIQPLAAIAISGLLLLPGATVEVILVPAAIQVAAQVVVTEVAAVVEVIVIEGDYC